MWLWNSFQFLSETRDYGMGGPLRIKPTEMKAVLDLRGVKDPDDVELFMHVIPQLDSEWINNHYEKVEADKKPDKRRRK